MTIELDKVLHYYNEFNGQKSADYCNMLCFFLLYSLDETTQSDGPLDDTTTIYRSTAWKKLCTLDVPTPHFTNQSLL